MSKRVAIMGLALLLGLCIATVAHLGYDWVALALLLIITLGIFWIDV